MSETNNTDVVTVEPGFSSLANTSPYNEEVDDEEKKRKRELAQDCYSELPEPCCSLCAEMLRFLCCLSFWSATFRGYSTHGCCPCFCCCVEGCCEGSCECCNDCAGCCDDCAECCDGCAGCCDDCAGCCDGCCELCNGCVDCCELCC